MAMPVWSKYFLNISACFFFLLASSLIYASGSLTSSYSGCEFLGLLGDLGDLAGSSLNSCCGATLMDSTFLGYSILMSSFLASSFLVGDSVGACLGGIIVYY
jgi:hypothetical protein